MKFVPIHDHTEDRSKGPERVREAAYRRGCHQALGMAIQELRDHNIPLSMGFLYLDKLVVELQKMRFSRKAYPNYMNQAMQKAWAFVRKDVS